MDFVQIETLYWIGAGIVSGALLGITGAGGAVGAFPFFIFGLNFGIKEATALSLFPVFFGAALNAWVQRKNAILWVGTVTALSSFVASYYFAGVKQHASQEIVKWIFTVVCAFSVYSVWKKKKEKPGKLKNLNAKGVLQLFLLSMLLGMAVTMVGTGGGIFLVPFYLGVLRMPMAGAVATSLVTITIASAGSFAFQFSNIRSMIKPLDVIWMTLGIVISAILVKFLMDRVPPKKSDPFRKAVFTLAAIAALYSVHHLKN